MRSHMPKQSWIMRSGFFSFHCLFAFAGALILAASSLAGTVPGNLGSGLDVLVRERQADREAQLAAQKGRKAPRIDSELAQQAAEYRSLAFINELGQVKVYVHLRPHSMMERFSFFMAVLPESAEVSAVDESYRAGVIEAFVSLDDIAALAADPRVSSIILAIRPILDVGTATTQGVVQHRVDQVTQNGTGITVGAMSDSYARSNNAITAAVDVSTGDLPGPGNPAGNTLPVVVLDDPIAGATDEGRAMMQIIHDIAPKSKIGFATGATGQVSFADNIRSLAGLPSGSHTVPGFNANVIVDDLYYPDSPMFGTSLAGKAVDQVAALGVSYFSSAGNLPSQQGYFSDYRNVPSGNLATALAGTNIPASAFSTIDPASYAGGFHNFRNDGGQDIAQTLSGTGGSISFQWDDPYDVEPPTHAPAPFFTSTGTITGATPVNFSVTLTAGQGYFLDVAATSGDLDAMVTIIDPNGAQVLFQDAGVDEHVYFFAGTTGSHTVSVTRFGPTTGNFSINAYTGSSTVGITVDYNLFFFRSDTGAFIKQISAKNFATNQPLEFGTLSSTIANTQLVIARANIPTVATSTKIRYVNTAVRVAEYFDYQTPMTYGHNHEPGCISVAAYSPFRPYIPEDFTSPGPSYIYFDQNATRLATPVVRQKPDVAAMDGPNNTFFSSDTTSDSDTLPNFFGTSAAASHAAGIAALVLQANGGPASVTPIQMKLILQGSGGLHDLDPFYSLGNATPNGGTLAITARANSGTGGDSTTLSTNDLNVFGVSYNGPGFVKTLFINVAGANTTGGSEASPAAVPGLAWDIRAFPTGFPFAVGRTSGGTLLPADISNAYTGTPSPLGVAGQQFNQLELTFADNKFVGGNSFTFGADRDVVRPASLLATSTVAGNSADLFGATVSIPAGTIVPGGATFSGTMNGGTPFSGTFVNNIGSGFSTLDGFGFINAQYAVSLSPTTVGLRISGRVLTSGGRGVRGASVVISDSLGQTRSVRTGPLGNFVITNIQAGETYVVSVFSRRFQFTPRQVQITDNIVGLNFVAAG